ncbi:HIT family protein [Xanthobacter sediminis]
MSDAPAYDPDNIFAKILRGELPAHKVYEDDDTLAFLDIMPRCPGHTLVIPKNPARNIFDIDAEDLARVARVAKTIAIAAKAAFKADGAIMMQFSEAAAGQEVFHLHIHVIPRHEGVAMKPPASQIEKPEVLAEHAALLRAALGR